MGIECLDGGIGKLLPSMALVAPRLVLPYGECGVQQQNPLLCPSREIAGHRNRSTKVLLYLLEDILKRRGKCHTVAHRETEPMCLPWAMIGILTDDHHLHLVDGTEIESIEYQTARGIACGGLILLAYKIRKRDEIRLSKFINVLLFS